MKKMFFYAAIASVAFAGCSKVNDLPSYSEENEEKQAIEFKMSTNIEVATRGTGAVGDVDGANNVWNGQKLKVYMFEQGTMNLAMDGTDPYFENADLTAPTASASEFGVYNGGTAKYYGPNKEDNYDFFAYYIDDAATAEPTLTTDSCRVPFTIDGTQDLMVAKAKVNDADETTITDWEAVNSKVFDRARIYSAYAARRNVHPRFTFNHLLSRLVFTAKAADDDALNVVIEKVTIKGAKCDGTMTVAALDEAKLKVWFTDNTADFVLANDDNTAEDMSTKKLLDENTVYTLGKNMLLAPNAEINEATGAAEYQLEVVYSQEKNGEDLRATYTAAIPAPATTEYVFKAGYQYNVNIIVYGFEEIKLVCDLVPWEEGGDIPLDPEN